MAGSGEHQSPQARFMGYRGNLRQWRTVTAADAVGGTVKLGPDDVSVIATIPLESGDNYSLELPDPAEAFERDIVIIGKRAAGSYSNGAVQVTAPPTRRFDLPTIDPMVATDARLHVRNVRGQWYDVISDSWTA